MKYRPRGLDRFFAAEIKKMHLPNTTTVLSSHKWFVVPYYPIARVHGSTHIHTHTHSHKMQSIRYFTLWQFNLPFRNLFFFFSSILFYSYFGLLFFFFCKLFTSIWHLVYTLFISGIVLCVDQDQFFRNPACSTNYLSCRWCMGPTHISEEQPVFSFVFERFGMGTLDVRIIASK